MDGDVNSQRALSGIGVWSGHQRAQDSPGPVTDGERCLLGQPTASEPKRGVKAQGGKSRNSRRWNPQAPGIH